MMEEVEDDSGLFRLSNLSITSVDAGLEGLEIKSSPQNICEWLASCCSSCLKISKDNQTKPNDISPKAPVLQMQDFKKNVSRDNGFSTEELRSSFHFSRNETIKEGEDEEEEHDIITDMAASETNILAYEIIEESVRDKIPHETFKEILSNPSYYLTSEHSEDIRRLAAARQELLSQSPQLREELSDSSNPRSQASLTRIMTAKSDLVEDTEAQSDSRSRSGTLNPLIEQTNADTDMEAVDEIVSTVEAGKTRRDFGVDGSGGDSFSFRESSLSKRWAGHLSEISPTQGKISRQLDDDGYVVLKVRPKWPDWLIDVSFDVVKTNKYGRRQQRQLKLTKYHIANIKDNSRITRLHKYKAVKHAYLVRSNTFVLEFFDELKNPPLFYESLLAGQIVQQVSTRVQVRSALEDVSLDPFDLHGFNKSMGFSVRATKSLVDVVSAEKYNRESNMLDFARNLGSLATPICESINVSVVELNLDKETEDGIFLKLTNIECGSRESSVKQAVEAIILNKSGPAGNTTNHFIEKFRKNPSATDLVEVRHFVDGMHEYILENNVVNLVAFYQEGPTSPSSRTSSRSNSGSQTFSASAKTIDVTKADLVVVSYIIFVVVEEVVFFPIQDLISSQYFLDKQVLEKELLLVRKMNILSARHQHEWNISQNHQSPAAWSSAIFELAGIERNPTPSMRLQALVHTAKAIYSEFKCEIMPILRAEKGDNLKESDAALGADDFLPIFIFVACRAGLRRPTFSKDLLWQLCHPDQLHGECGYYLTVYESALEYIMCENVPSELLCETDIDESMIMSTNEKLTQVPDNPVRRTTLL